MNGALAWHDSTTSPRHHWSGTPTTMIFPRQPRQFISAFQLQAHTLHTMNYDKTNGQLVEEVAQIILGMDQAVSHNRAHHKTRTDIYRILNGFSRKPCASRSYLWTWKLPVTVPKEQRRFPIASALTSMTLVTWYVYCDTVPYLY